MDPQNVPKRPLFWFNHRPQIDRPIVLFDQITVIICLILGFISFMLFWPITATINFEEAFYTPLIPFLMAILKVFGQEANEAMRILFIASMVVSTITFYLLVRDLTRRQITPILAAFIYLFPLISIFMLTFLRPELYHDAFISAKSIFTIVYGDGAHFLALALIPVVILFCLRYLKQAKKSDLAGAVLTFALVLLANRVQAINLILILIIVALSECFLGQARQRFKRFLLFIVLTVGLVAFWYTPSFWHDIFTNLIGQMVPNLKYLFPLPLTLGILGLLISFIFFGKQEGRQPVFIAFLAFIVFLSIAADWLWHQRSFMPHPQRLVANLNMFGAFVLALALSAIIDRIRLVEIFTYERWSLPMKVLGSVLFGAICLIVLAVLGFLFWPYAILVFSNPDGYWAKIKMGILADRQERLALAGENFKLVQVVSEHWEIWTGIFLSLFCTAILIYLLLAGGREEKN